MGWGWPWSAVVELHGGRITREQGLGQGYESRDSYPAKEKVAGKRRSATVGRVRACEFWFRR